MADVVLGQDWINAVAIQDILGAEALVSTNAPSEEPDLVPDHSRSSGHAPMERQPDEPDETLNLNLNTQIFTEDISTYANENHASLIRSAVDIMPPTSDFSMNASEWAEASAQLDDSRSPSPSPVNPVPLVPPPPLYLPSRPGLETVTCNLFQRSTIPSRISLFSNKLNDIRSLLKCHAVTIPATTSLEETRLVLIQHIFKGHCFETAASGARGADINLCRHISEGYSSAMAMTLDFINLIVNDNRPHPNFTGDNACTLVNALYHPAHSPVADLSPGHRRRDAISAMKMYRDNRTIDGDIVDIVANRIENMDRSELMGVIRRHGISTQSKSVGTLRDLIIKHLSTGTCAEVDLTGLSDVRPACRQRVLDFRKQTNFPDSPEYFALHSISEGLDKWDTKPLRRLLISLGVPFPKQSSKKGLRKALHVYLKESYKGKSTQYGQFTQRDIDEMSAKRETWPQLVPQTLKDKIVHMFRHEISKSEQSRSTCGSCVYTYARQFKG
ncbi:hypothetical protein C8J56DRAFT_1052762 [Mycena floridula]|nr:hypothetical protein C8J56DRAFT_1052762 [Mycena floridula]